MSRTPDSTPAKTRKNAAYQEKELFTLAEGFFRCNYCDFALDVSKITCMLQCFDAAAQMEQHFNEKHAQNFSEERSLQWFAQHLPMTGKLRIAQQCIDDLQLPFFRTNQNRLNYVRYNTDLAKYFNRLLEKGLIRSLKTTKGWYYTFEPEHSEGASIAKLQEK